MEIDNQKHPEKPCPIVDPALKESIDDLAFGTVDYEKEVRFMNNDSKNRYLYWNYFEKKLPGLSK